MQFKGLLAGAAAAVLASLAVAAPAGAVVITNGAISVGVNQYGQMLSNDGAGNLTGLRYNNGGADVLTGGAPRDSWGANNAAGDDEGGSSYGIVSADLTSTANSAVSTVLTEDGLQLRQAFSFVADNIVMINITLTNTTGDELSALFQRLADFDVDPNSDETVVDPYGNTVENTYVGFLSPSVYDSWDGLGCYGCAYNYDAGAGFRFNFGALGAGQSRTVKFYYGIGGGSDELAAQMQAIGVKNMLVATGADGTLSAAMGVSVPEPSTWAMMLLGFFGLGSMIRRRKAALA